MKTIAIEDAHDRFAELIDDVRHGESVTITEAGIAVAVLNPVEKRRLSPEEAKRALEQLREFRKGITLGNDLTIRDLIEEGRRY